LPIKVIEVGKSLTTARHRKFIGWTDFGENCKILGLTMPPSLPASADKVIE
jgi:hypothetical protein